MRQTQVHVEYTCRIYVLSQFVLNNVAMRMLLLSSQSEVAVWYHLDSAEGVLM